MLYKNWWHSFDSVAYFKGCFFAVLCNRSSYMSVFLIGWKMHRQIAVTCHNLSLLVNCFQKKLLWCVLLMQPLNFSLLHVHKENFHCNLTYSLWCSPYHQYVYSPHCSLHISCDTHNENLFESWGPLSLAIVSFIPMTLLCDSAVIRRN